MGHSCLPFGDGPVCNSQFFGELHLRQFFLLAALGDEAPDLCLIHAGSSLCFVMSASYTERHSLYTNRWLSRGECAVIRHIYHILRSDGNRVLGI